MKYFIRSRRIILDNSLETQQMRIEVITLSKVSELMHSPSIYFYFMKVGFLNN